MKLMARRGFWRVCALEGMTGLLDGLRTAFIIIACAFVFLALLSAPLYAASTEDDARSAIVVAKERVTVCYAAVAEAERVGANVTNLLSTLNEAGMLLSRADLAFGKGDFGSAYDLAVQSKAKLTWFVVEANLVKDTAEQNKHMDFMINIVGSSVATVAIIVGSFAVWSGLKRRYVEAEQVEPDES